MEQASKIAILGGTGSQGNGLALRLARAGHQVIIGSRDGERARATAAEVSGRIGKPVAGAGNRDAAGAAETVILTVPYAVQRATVEDVRDRLTGKILVDATVPLVPPRVSVVQLPEGQSAVATLQDLLGKDVRVVSAFQNVSAEHLADLEHEIDCDVLICGDDAAACAHVVALCTDIGLRGLHAGSIRNSVAAEALTSLLIAINRRYKVKGGAGIRITGIPTA
ncbi:MAG: NADPH-dependent F420 reductase [Hyphomicrobiales bacterium]|nr:NADPH-dependent F420 reductase [Hyphomicrobiales bacterium]